jgi:hypothetical protein
MYRGVRANATTSLNLSSWSVILAASLRNFGAKDHKSTILYIEDLGSKILTGREI